MQYYLIHIYKVLLVSNVENALKGEERIEIGKLWLAEKKYRSIEEPEFSY